MRDDELEKLIMFVDTCWPNLLKINEATFSVWKAILEDLPASEALDAVKAFSRSGDRYPPTPGMIYDSALKAKLPPRVTSAEAITLVYDMFTQFRPVGWVNSPSLRFAEEHLGDHPEVLKALNAVGISRWYNASLVERGYIQREFLKLLEGIEVEKQKKKLTALSAPSKMPQIGVVLARKIDMNRKS